MTTRATFLKFGVLNLFNVSIRSSLTLEPFQGDDITCSLPVSVAKLDFTSITT